MDRDNRRFEPRRTRLDIEIDFAPAAASPAELRRGGLSGYDTERMTWRHLNSSSTAYLNARVRACAARNARQKDRRAWARPEAASPCCSRPW